MRDRRGLPIAHNDIGGTLKDGLHQLRDVRPAILIVGIRVDDDVGAQREAAIESSAKRAGEPEIGLVAQHVIDAEVAADQRPQRPVRRLDQKGLDLPRGNRNAPLGDVIDIPAFLRKR